MNVLSPYENVTVLYGHIHAMMITKSGTFTITRPVRSSLLFQTRKRQPIKTKSLDKDSHSRTWESALSMKCREKAGGNTVAVEDVELTAREFSGINGISTDLKTPNF